MIVKVLKDGVVVEVHHARFVESTDRGFVVSSTLYDVMYPPDKYGYVLYEEEDLWDLCFTN